jgi:hypothetical protein
MRNFKISMPHPMSKGGKINGIRWEEHVTQMGVEKNA